MTIDQNDQDIPTHPTIPYIVGDGIGPEIWQAAQPIWDQAVRQAYGGGRKLHWQEALAGSKALEETGDLLPAETMQALTEHPVSIKGPLATPVGGGFRSLNVTLRQALDLYACVRPIRWIPGVPSPVCHPEKVDMVIFRENTEDLYAGIEFQAESLLNQQLRRWLEEHDPELFARLRFPDSSAFSLKPISREGSQRLMRAALHYALTHHRKRLTLVHKGNIMKFTEGAFLNWGYDLAESEFGDRVITQRQIQQQTPRQQTIKTDPVSSSAATEKLWVNDVITDAAFEQTLTQPEAFDIIATMNLNGDYLSDALTAQVGGLGIAPGANVNTEANRALFEATHGTAPSLAGRNCANPCSLILSGAMMLSHLGWQEAADLVEAAIRATLALKIITPDFQRLMPDIDAVTTAGFSEAVLQQMATLTSNPARDHQENNLD